MSQRTRTSFAARAAAAGAIVAFAASITGCTPARETVSVRSNAAPSGVVNNDTAVAEAPANDQPVYRFGAGDSVGRSNYRIYKDEVLDADATN